MATIMYNMHEMPAHARRRVLRNAQRLARRTVLVVDIWPGFEPTPMMLAGEPCAAASNPPPESHSCTCFSHFDRTPHGLIRSYVIDYLEKIDDEIEASCGKSWLARMIGPATSCGKNAMKSAKRVGERSGSMSPR